MSLLRSAIVAVLEILEGDPALTKRVRTLVAPSDAADEWLTLSELGVSACTARHAIKTKKLRASMVGREYRVRRADRDEWLASLQAPTCAEPEDEADRAIARAVSAGRIRVIAGRGR